ncbi:hypothetical protein NQ317_019929 [Molorchus minor]|uniref:Uncharacterized protein n=1 Tax=Molorchus minor TaxID=1323400 RepID=A0ABQ9K4M3_9CUCU|nr:hypothetical protein NQ317_019929 [Molorchus minor]
MKRNETDWKTINWKEIAKKFPGFSHANICSMFKMLVHYYIPRKKRSDLKECLRILNEVLVKPNNFASPHKLIKVELLVITSDIDLVIKSICLCLSCLLPQHCLLSWNMIDFSLACSTKGISFPSFARILRISTINVNHTTKIDFMKMEKLYCTEGRFRRKTNLQSLNSRQGWNQDGKAIVVFCSMPPDSDRSIRHEIKRWRNTRYNRIIKMDISNRTIRIWGQINCRQQQCCQIWLLYANVGHNRDKGWGFNLIRLVEFTV